MCAGHTSWSTSGLAYLSLWLAGKLRCFDGHGHPWKAIVSVMPTGLAVWIGITRLQVSWSAFVCVLLFTVVAGEMLGRVLKGCTLQSCSLAWLSGLASQDCR